MYSPLHKLQYIFMHGAVMHEVCKPKYTEYVEIKCQLDATDEFYCRSYCLLNMFRAPLCNKIWNNIHLLHLAGILFPHIIDDARSKPHKIQKYTELDTKCWPYGCSTTLRTKLSTYVEGRC
jgi:hypothetical protein